MYAWPQGRTQDFFRGGARFAIFEGIRKRGRKAPERGEGLGGGVPDEGAFAFFLIEIERSGAHFGWILFGEIVSKTK